MTDAEFSLTIPADTFAIPGVTAALETILAERGFEEDEIHDIQLAVEEAITNVIVHGYRDLPGMIAVRSRVSAEMAEIAIEDSAPPFDPLLLPEPDTSSDLDDRTIGGLGVHFIRELMDGIEYRYENGKNILVLVKWRAF